MVQKKSKRRYEVLNQFIHKGVGYCEGMLVKERFFDPDTLESLLRGGYLREYKRVRKSRGKRT